MENLWDKATSNSILTAGSFSKTIPYKTQRDKLSHFDFLFKQN